MQAVNQMGAIPLSALRNSMLIVFFHKMLTEALLFGFVVTLVGSERISEAENRKLKSNCMGYTKSQVFGSARRSKFKSLGGRPVFSNEYPFLASITHIDSGTVMTCSGVLISSRHVLTAAHCITSGLQNFSEVCEHENEFLWSDWRKLSGFSIHLGSKCRKPSWCVSPHETIKVFVREHWGKCDYTNDIAVIELTKNANPAEARPICMPDADTELDTVLKAAGIGFDPTAKGIDAVYNDLQVVELMRNEIRSYPGIIYMWSTNASVCKGDSGGPLFQSNRARMYTVVGISTASTRCDLPLEKRISYFVDVRRHLEWICDKTGVCPIKNATQATGVNKKKIFHRNLGFYRR